MNILYALLEKLKEQWCPYCGGEHTNCVLDKKWFSHLTGGLFHDRV